MVWDNVYTVKHLDFWRLYNPIASNAAVMIFKEMSRESYVSTRLNLAVLKHVICGSRSDSQSISRLLIGWLDFDRGAFIFAMAIAGQICFLIFLSEAGTRTTHCSLSMSPMVRFFRSIVSNTVVFVPLCSPGLHVRFSHNLLIVMWINLAVEYTHQAEFIRFLIREQQESMHVPTKE
jgi:hypothetical protein